MKKSSKHPTDKSKKHDDAQSILITGLPFEDRLWLFWKKYSRIVTLIIVIIIFGFLGYKGIDFYKRSQIEKLQNEYRIALEEGREFAFAEANIKEPLAGGVFLSTADKFGTEGKYQEAIINYNKALTSLKPTPFGDRIRLSIALATWMKGNHDASKKLLNELLNDSQVMGAIRAEAAYQLALMSLNEQDYKKSREFLDTINRIPNAGVWGQKALILRDSTPELFGKL